METGPTARARPTPKQDSGGGWYARFRAVNPHATVRQPKVSTRTPGRKGYAECQRLIDEAMRADERAAAEAALGHDPTVREWFDRFIAGERAAGTPKGTIGKFEWALLKACAPLHDHRLTTLRPRDVSAWRESLPHDAHDAHRLLRQALQQAVREEVIERNVAAVIRNPLPKRQEVRVMLRGEADAIAERLRVMRDPGRRLHLFVVVTFGLGLRPAEALGLAAGDAELERSEPVVFVRRQAVDGEAVPRTKTPRSRRRVPCPPWVAGALREALDGIDADAPVIPNARGGWLNRRNFTADSWWPAVGSAKVGDEAVAVTDADGRKLIPYTARHGYAALLIAAGVQTFEIAQRMGTSVQMIDRTYGHLLGDADRRFLDRLGEYEEQAHAAAAPTNRDGSSANAST